jgi:very-short-patch-repair endonuclease
MSDAANTFAALWKRFGYQLRPPVREYRFSPPRRWRFDFAWPTQMVAVEIEGLVFRGKSRHTTQNGYIKDCEKYNAAVEKGWHVLRYTQVDLRKRPVQVLEQVKRVLGLTGEKP